MSVVNSHRWAAITGFSHAVPFEGVTVQLIRLPGVTRTHCVVAHNRLRAKYIQQIKELHSLFESGALTKTEFLDQKRPVLEQLKKFNLYLDGCVCIMYIIV